MEANAGKASVEAATRAGSRETDAGKRRKLGIELALAAWVFVAHAYFYNGVGGNQNARLDPAYSFVEPGTPWTGTFRMDQFASTRTALGNSHDWSEHEGRIYSSKAPGTIWASALVYLPLYHLQASLGIDPTALAPAVLNSYAIHLLVSVLLTAIASVALFRHLGGTRDALLKTATLSFATLLFPFDTQLWGHSTAAALLILSLVCSRRPALAGFFAALAASTDYVAAVGLLAGAALCLDPSDGSDPESRRARLLRFGLGAALPLGATGLYHWMLFGNPMTLATSKAFPLYGSVPGRNSWGVGGVSPGAVLEMFFYPKRGILVYMPVLLFSIGGLVALLRDRARRYFAAVCAGTVLVMALGISTFAIWWGGWSSGHRYLIVGLPYLALLLPDWSRMRAWAKGAYAALAGVSLANMLCIAAVNPMAHEGFPNPLLQYLYPSLLMGKLQQNHSAIRLFQSPEEKAATVFNLGEKLLGLGPWGSVLLLAAFLALGYALLDRALSRREAPTG